VGKGANKELLSNSGVAQSNSNALYGQGGGINSFLTPTLESEAANPQGYTPQQLAYMNTASQQSLGGGAAATTGEANLAAARTRNAGGFQGAVGEANRGAQRQLSQNALGIQNEQANLQQQQKQEALKSLQSLYGIDESTALGYLNSSNSALGTETEAGNPLINDIAGLGKGLGSLAYGANQGAQAYNNA
jgi:hypothetical protein